MPKKVTGKPAPVPRCPDRGHGHHKRGCPDCQRYSAYVSRLRRWESINGIDNSRVPVGPVADHVQMLLGEGNWKMAEMARVSGIPARTIQHVRLRQVDYTFPITAQCLLALQPREQAGPPRDGYVPARTVADHVDMLLTEGNWKMTDLERASGISSKTIWAVWRRKVEYTSPITAQCLLALQPREQARPPRDNYVPATEVVRLVRGLSAQGWTFTYISSLLGNTGKAAAQRLAYKTEWVTAGSADRVRAVADRLRLYDIRQFDKPMPGMDIRVARDAKCKGWVPLVAWYGQDIADPAAEPWKIRPTGSPLVTPVVRPADGDDDLPEVEPWSYIDPILTLRVADAVDTVRNTARQAGRRGDGYITPIPRLTRLEVHAIAEYATTAGLVTPDVAQLIGHSVATDRARGNAMRAVERMKNTVRKSRAILARLASGEHVDPAWMRQAGENDGNKFVAVAAVLLAVQGAPFGPGWSPAELAYRAGVGEDEIREFLAYATHRGDREWVPVSQVRRPAPAAVVPDVVPVALDAVLAA